MPNRHLISALSLLLAGVLPPASAQTPDRHGFYASIGGAFGSYDLKGDQGYNISDLSSDLKESFSGYVAFGGTISPGFRLGVETDGFWSSTTVTNTKYSLSSMMYSGVFTFYAMTDVNIFGRVYLGYVQNTLTPNIGHEGGFALGLGAGYDWEMRKDGLVLIPFVNYMTQLSGAKFSNDVSSNPEKYKSTLVQVGLGIGYRH